MEDKKLLGIVSIGDVVNHLIAKIKEENKNLKEQIEKLQTNLKRANKVIDQIEKVILISNKEWRVGLADADDD